MKRGRKSSAMSMAILILLLFASTVPLLSTGNSERIAKSASPGNEIAEKSLANAPWPMCHHDLNHTGLSPYDTSDNPGKLKWNFTTGDGVVSSPAIESDGTIYVGSSDDNLYAIGKAPPSPPQNLSAKAGDGYVNLTWEKPMDDGGSAITEYKIYRDGILIKIVPASQLWYNHTSVNNGQTYTYYVSAVNSVGESDRSNEVSATPGGAVPRFSAMYMMIGVLLMAALLRRKR